jgi:hypothetical protein
MIRLGVCLLLTAGMAQSQVKTGIELSDGTKLLASGISLRYKTVIEPPLKSSAFAPKGLGFNVSANTMHNFIYDDSAQSYFRYDMTVSESAAADQRTVVFSAMTGLRDALHAVAGTMPLNAAPLPKYPPPQVVQDGDTIALDLMISADGKERIVDYIQFEFAPKPEPPPPAATAAPQDFTLDDGPMNFPVDPPDAVTINRQKFLESVVVLAAQRGATMWVYLPGHGRYILSLAPHAGFARSGTLRAGAIEFSSSGVECAMHFPKPIAGRDKARNLYVLHDPRYLPRSAMVKVAVTSADRLENLLPKE